MRAFSDRSGLKFAHVVVTVAVVTVVIQTSLMFRHQCCLWKHNVKYEDNKVRLIPYEQLYEKRPTSDFGTLEPCAGKDQNMYVPRPIPLYKRYLTIGIPTVKRRDGEYFMDMLSSMFNKTPENDLKKIIFVIFLADLNNTEWKLETEARLRKMYSTHIESGGLEILQAPPEFYKDMTDYGNDSYMVWRTKQNYDYAYMMKYSGALSEYYIQMEDDVVASDGYLEAITTYIGNQSIDNWVCLEFSELGFIGKLYHSKHLENLANMLLMFSDEQPVDYTYLYFNLLLKNGPRRIRKPTLFQHMGYHSSLSEKVQPLRDKFFDFPAKEWKGDNPIAQIYTTFKQTDSFPPNLAYSQEAGYFWSASSATVGDVFLIVFDSPQSLTKIAVETGSNEHPADIIGSATVEACVSVSEAELQPMCDNQVPLKDFENGKVFVNTDDISPKLGVIKAKGIQIRITETQKEWVIIKEIAVFVSN